MKNFLRVILLALTVVLLMPGAEARAGQPTCDGLFFSANADFQKTDAYRRALLSTASRILSVVRAEQSVATAKVQVEIERRGEIKPGRILGSIVESATLGDPRVRMQPQTQEAAMTIFPPTIHSRTLELILNPRADLQKLRAALDVDPYFIWMQTQGLRYQRSQNDDLKLVSREINEPYDQAHPTKLLLRYREEELNERGSKAHLELALVRLMRNMDPMLSPSGILASSSALFHDKLRIALEEKVVSHLNSRQVEASTDAWLLMPSLRVGQDNLKKLIDEQSAYFGKLFPRVAYEKAQVADTQARSLLAAYRVERVRGRAEADIIHEFEPQLLELKKKLRVPVEFPMNRLYDIVDKIISIKNEGSYESILADVFDPKSGKLIRDLRPIVEIADAISSNEKFTAYLRHLVESEYEPVGLR